MRRPALAAIVTLLVLAAGPWQPPAPTWSADRGRPTSADAVLLGTVSCRQPVTLPRMATLRVELMDTSARDAHGAVVGEDTHWITSGKLPADFLVRYDPSRIDPSHVYIVRARVLDGDTVLLMGTASHPVLLRGASRTVDVVVAPARSGLR
jgi:putative lipoprotein